MKALLVIDNDKTAKEYSDMLTLKNCACIRYCQPLKAMDNLEEIEPELIFISSIDFPRHWKPFIQYAQSTLSDETAIFLIANNFSEDEEKKAKYLHVKKVIYNDSPLEEREKIMHSLLMKYLFSSPTNEEEILFTRNNENTEPHVEVHETNIIETEQDDPIIEAKEETNIIETEQDTLENTVDESLQTQDSLIESADCIESESEIYVESEDVADQIHYVETSTKKLEVTNENTDASLQSETTLDIAEIEQSWSRKAKEQFMFIHPITDCIITGIITQITEDGFMFEPDWEDETSDIQIETTIRLCSLYTNEAECIRPVVQVLQNNGNQIEFIYI